jgi:hypothetical protein
MSLEKNKRMTIHETYRYQSWKESEIVEGPKLDSIYYTHPLNTRKVKIDIEENPKFAHIGDY